MLNKLTLEYNDIKNIVEQCHVSVPLDNVELTEEAKKYLYENNLCFEIPSDCGHCPCGYYTLGEHCGRRVPLDHGKRPESCKLRLLNYMVINITTEEGSNND